MKYLLFTLEYPPFKGGVGHYYKNLVGSWPEKNIRVLADSEGKEKGVITKRLTGKFIYPRWLPAIWHLTRTIKKRKINYVLVGHILPLGTVAWLLSHIFKYKYAVFLHGMDFTSALATKRKKWLSRKIINRADKVILGNTFLAEFFKKEFKKEFKVINPGIDPHSPQIDKQKKEKIKVKYDLGDDKLVLFSLGRLVERKGFDKVIESLPRVFTESPDLYYFLAGDGEDKERLEKIKDNLKPEQKKRIVFLGKISETEKWTWLDLADIFIMPARKINNDFEGFGIVYLEANLVETPVIGGKSGGVVDVISRENGILVDPRDTRQISESILKLAQDKNFREKLGKQGRDRAIQQFSWQKKAGEIYNYLNKP